MTVYDYVKVLVEERKLKVNEVESALGFGNGTISKWTNSVPKADKLYEVAKYFDVPLEYFLTGSRPIKDKMEQVLLNAYRISNEEGKANIIHVCIEERNKSTAELKGEVENVG